MKFIKYALTIIVVMSIMSCSSKYKEINYIPENYSLLTDILSENNIIYPEEIQNSNNIFRIKSNNNIYYMYQWDFKSNFNSDSIVIKKIHDDIAQNIKVYIPKKTWILDFAINDTSLYVLASGFIYKYSIINEKMNLTQVVGIEDEYDKNKLSAGYDRIDFMDSTVAIYTNVFGKLYRKPKIKLYDLKTMQVINHKEFENTKGAMLNYEMPKRCISVYKDKILLSNLTEYKIKIYDKNFNLKNEINYNPKNWIFNDYLNDLKKELDEIDDFNKFRAEYSKYTVLPCIRTVDFINDTSIIVSRYLNESKFTCYDIWIEKEGKWSIYKEDLFDIGNNLPKDYSNDIIGESYNVSYLGAKYYIENSCMIVPIDLPFKLDSNLRRKTKKELNNIIEKYYESNSNIKAAFIFYKFK